MLLCLVIFLTGIPLPELVVESCEMVGSITSPLSMLVLGANRGNVPAEKLPQRYPVLCILSLPTADHTADRTAGMQRFADRPVLYRNCRALLCNAGRINGTDDRQPVWW